MEEGEFVYLQVRHPEQPHFPRRRRTRVRESRVNDDGLTGVLTYLWWGILRVIVLLVVVAVPSSSLIIAPRGVVARISLLLVLVVLVIAGLVSGAGLPRSVL